jgi:NTE family protein
LSSPSPVATDMNAQASGSKSEPNNRAFRVPDAARPLAISTFRPRGRIVTLASFLPPANSDFVAESLARLLHAETGQSVLLIQVERTSTGIPAQDWPVFQRGINSAFWFADQLATEAGGFGRLVLRVRGDPQEAGHIAALLYHCARHFRHVLVQNSAATMPLAHSTSCFCQSDLSFILMPHSEGSLIQFDLLLREIRQQPTGNSVKTILCVSESENTRSFTGVIRQMGGSIHGCIHHCPPAATAAQARHWNDERFFAGVRRLAREIAGRRLGLALSAGGARGLAHIGVIQVLEENGIEVDAIAGTSMGAYVGAVWAYGYGGMMMETLAREVEHRWGLLQLVDPFILPRQGFLRGERVKRRLQKSIGNVHFSELVRPLRVVATHLETLDRVVFSAGEVAAAVHASSAIPGICAPVEIAGEKYIDGGISDPLPVDVLREMGMDRIIAVNTIPPPAFLRCRMEMEREQAGHPNRKTHPLREWMNRYVNYFAPGNILDTMMRAVHGAQIRVAEQAGEQADLVLRPLSLESRWHDFRHPGKYIALGRKVTEEHLEEIKALIARKEPAYEEDFNHDTMAAVA